MLPINLSEYEARARQRMDPIAFDYYASGANDEITLGENERAYARLRLRYRVLRGVDSRDLETRLFGHPLDFPVILAPTAFHRLAHPDGELASARAAERLGTLMTLSTLSTTAVEEVVGATRAPVWFQLYVYKDRELTAALVRRAEAAGCQALVLTVDAPPLGRRERDIRNRFYLPPGLEVRNLLPAGLETLPQVPAGSGLAAYTDALLDPGLRWQDLDWLAQQTRLPLLVKGIVHPEDARLAVEHGARGLWVSNHGGRQLDTAIPTIEALPDIAEAVGGRAELILDGGIRRGTDVIKALARGARAVAVGRPLLWGLATNGEDGVVHALSLLRDEIDLALALCGARRVEDLEPDLVRDAPRGPAG